MYIRDSQNNRDFDPDALAQALTYNTDGTLATVTAGPDKDGFSYKQTLTYTSGKLSNVSAWVRQ